MCHLAHKQSKSCFDWTLSSVVTFRPSHIFIVNTFSNKQNSSHIWDSREVSPNMHSFTIIAVLFTLTPIPSVFSFLFSPLNIAAMSPKISQEISEPSEPLQISKFEEKLKAEKVLGPPTSASSDSLKELPKGTNLEASPNDLIRMAGTRWCGQGWRADSAKAMGGYSGADRCCRHHDLGCPDSIDPGESKYGLVNRRISTLMHCSCDERFRSCLRMTRTQAADIVGNIFFNTLHTPCFTVRKTRVCSITNWWGHCLRYSEEDTAVWRKPVPYVR